jgi:hypothetical protein
MPDDIQQVLMNQGGTAGIIGFIVLCIIRGWLVPRKTLEDVRADRDARIGEANARAVEWKEAYTTLSAATQQLMHQSGELLAAHGHMEVSGSDSRRGN